MSNDDGLEYQVPGTKLLFVSSLGDGMEINMKDNKIVRKHIIFWGRVQGVGFRYNSVYKARQLGLVGWVKNMDDGSVEMEVQGREAEIDQLILFLDRHLWIRIDTMNVQQISVRPESEFVEM